MGEWKPGVALSELTVRAKRVARMERVDALTPELRALVHEYGLMVVNAFIQIGITKPRHIRHLVETVLDEFSPTRGATSAQGIRPAPEFREPTLPPPPKD